MEQFEAKYAGLAEIHSYTDMNICKLFLMRSRSVQLSAISSPPFRTWIGINIVVISHVRKGGVEILVKCSLAILMAIGVCLKAC